MKYIQKNRTEPIELKQYRETTDNPTYEGLNKKSLQLALLKEQGYICAYCMRRISLDLNEHYEPQIGIEHYYSQSSIKKDVEDGFKKDKKKSLIYTNLLGVCNGNFGKKPHCDKSRNYKDGTETRSYKFKQLNPLIKAKSEDLITYSLNGEVKSIKENPEVEEDIRMLNLNHQTLIDLRKDALDKAWKAFKKQYPDKDWTIQLFDKEIEKYRSKDQKGMYKAFCQFIIWHFEQLKKRNKYNLR